MSFWLPSTHRVGRLRLHAGLLLRERLQRSHRPSNLRLRRPHRLLRATQRHERPSNALAMYAVEGVLGPLAIGPVPHVKPRDAPRVRVPATFRARAIAVAQDRTKGQFQIKRRGEGVGSSNGSHTTSAPGGDRPRSAQTRRLATSRFRAESNPRPATTIRGRSPSRPRPVRPPWLLVHVAARAHP